MCTSAIRGYVKTLAAIAFAFRILALVSASVMGYAFALLTHLPETDISWRLPAGMVIAAACMLASLYIISDLRIKIATMQSLIS